MTNRFVVFAALLMGAVFVDSAAGGDPPQVAPRTLGQLLTSQGFTAIPMRRSMDQFAYFVSVEINKESFNLAVDTGSGRALVMTYPAVKKLVPTATDPDAKGQQQPFLRGVRYDVGIAIGMSFTGTQFATDEGIPIDQSVGFGVKGLVTNPLTGAGEYVRVDGILGQQYLLRHSAVIDSTTDTLYLKSYEQTHLPLWRGRWQCVSGERDGKTLADPESTWFEVGDEFHTTFHFAGLPEKTGRIAVMRAGVRDVVLGVVDTDKQPSPVYAYGIYQFLGNKLRLCLVDRNAAAIESKLLDTQRVPFKFAAPAESQYVLYEFVRKPADKLKGPAKP